MLESGAGMTARNTSQVSDSAHWHGWPNQASRFRVCAALRPAADRCEDVRFLATALACLDSAVGLAALLPSCLSAWLVARDRVRDGFLDFEADALSLWARRRVSADAAPCLGGGSATPARRAFDRPMAMACFVDRAPCLPSRIWSISSCTNSPACVDGALPSRLSALARLMVSLS